MLDKSNNKVLMNYLFLIPLLLTALSIAPAIAEPDTMYRIG